MKMRILYVQPISKWKFWKIDDVEVTVVFGSQLHRFSLYHPLISPRLFLHYCKNKCLGLNQYNTRTFDSDWENFWQQTVDPKCHNELFSTVFDVIGKDFEV